MFKIVQTCSSMTPYIRSCLVNLLAPTLRLTREIDAGFTTHFWGNTIQRLSPRLVKAKLQKSGLSNEIRLRDRTHIVITCNNASTAICYLYLSIVKETTHTFTGCSNEFNQSIVRIN